MSLVNTHAASTQEHTNCMEAVPGPVVGDAAQFQTEVTYVYIYIER